MRDFRDDITKAVRHFWRTRDRQSRRQGAASGQRDQGARSAVTGGKQLDGFVELVRNLAIDGGIDSSSIHVKSHLELPGYYRPEKKWDLIIVENGTLLAVVEFKSQVGPSFGNNYNNRTEEAIGNAQDIWTAFREGAFSASQRPWLGYLMLLEDTERSTTPVAVRQPHFPVFPEFIDSSYANRYETLLNKLVRERLYDSACFLMSSRTKGKRGFYTEPAVELAFNQFAASFVGRLETYLKAAGE